MGRQKSFSDFNLKDWRNFGFYSVLLGLIILFLGNDAKIGGAFIAIGVIMIVIFKGLGFKFR